MEIFSKDFYKEIYRQLENVDFEDGEEVEFELVIDNNYYIINGVVKYENVEYCEKVPYGNYEDFKENYYTERELSEIIINKVEIIKS